MICVTLHVLDELSYTFDHIWTNLLTQCTPVPVPISAVFVFLVFPILKVPQKFRKNYIKNQRRGSLWNHQKREGGDPPGLQAPWWCGPRGGARDPPGSLVDPLGAPSRIYCPRGGNP